MPERKVRIRLFNYTKDGRRRVAKKNDVVDFTDEEVTRGEKINAFYPVGSDSDPEPQKVRPYSEYTDPELLEFIEEERPSVNTLLKICADNKDLARRILAAENSVTGKHPRKTLVDGISTILGDS